MVIAATIALIPTAASAQDNVLINDVTVAATTQVDPAMDPAMDPALNATTNTLGDPSLPPMPEDPSINEMVISDTPPPEENDNDFPWGLLGLLGLAGLLGLKKKDDKDIHVDARHNTRP
jgi:hypothetical protein